MIQASTIVAKTKGKKTAKQKGNQRSKKTAVKSSTSKNGTARPRKRARKSAASKKDDMDMAPLSPGGPLTSDGIAIFQQQTTPHNSIMMQVPESPRRREHADLLLQLLSQAGTRPNISPRIPLAGVAPAPIRTAFSPAILGTMKAQQVSCDGMAGCELSMRDHNSREFVLPL